MHHVTVRTGVLKLSLGVLVLALGPMVIGPTFAGEPKVELLWPDGAPGVEHALEPLQVVVLEAQRQAEIPQGACPAALPEMSDVDDVG